MSAPDIPVLQTDRLVLRAIGEHDLNAPEHWRRGYASEAGAASMRWAFEHLGVEEVISVTLPDNVASRGVMEKIGMTFDRNEPIAGHDQVVYRIARHEWVARV